jgi:transposase
MYKASSHFFLQLPRMNRYPDSNSVLVCDNATYHRGERVPQLCQAAGVQLLYLPPYCPELNPIELCFAAIKQKIRSSQILNQAEDPEYEIRRVTAEVMTDELCYKLYQHCGYCVSHN